MTHSAQAPDAATIEEMIRKGWAAFFGMAETHNKGLHDGYHFGWGLGFEVGREASIADALSKPLAPARAVPAKNPAYDKGFSIGYHKGLRSERATATTRRRHWLDVRQKGRLEIWSCRCKVSARTSHLH